MGARVIVADTNLIAYLLIAGPFSEAAQRAFDRDGEWIAPLIWSHELLNVLATSVRAGHLNILKAQEIWAHAPAFVRDAEVPALDVLQLSVSTRLGTFDCYYVVLARKMGLHLVTADKQLLERCPDVAVSIEAFASGK